MVNRLASRRNLLSLIAGGAAAACVPFERSSPFWGTIGAGFKSRDKTIVEPEYVRNLPYATMLAWFDGGPTALVVLGEVAQDRRFTWYSPQKQSITTYGPFVVGILGFETELRGTIFSSGWTANPLELIGRKLTRTLDVSAEGDRVQVPLESKFSGRGAETVEILGTRRNLQRVREAVSYNGRARHSNHYWVEAATGRCWKSQQVAVPTLPVLNLEVTKYPTV